MIRRDLGVLIISKDIVLMFWAEYATDNPKVPSNEYSRILVQPSTLKEPVEAEIDDIKNLAVWLNSPWSLDHEGYEIKLNCKDAYTEMDSNEPKYRCLYHITGFDGAYASILGYGDNPYQALEDCDKIMDILQKKYNPENESI